MDCPVCIDGTGQLARPVDGVDYYRCQHCGSLFADPAFLAGVGTGETGHYDDGYWSAELKAARERSFGSSLQRVAETFLYCRIPIQRFIDIGSGPGYLLDALQQLMPRSSDVFHAVEMFPPPEPFRSRHPNYTVGSLGDLPQRFEAGCCIEVIEHLTPAMLRGLVAQLAARSMPGALYYFGSGNPDYVDEEDPGYLDPHVRGHVVSYSLKGLAPLFAEHGFQLLPIPGRNWAFLAEYGPAVPSSPSDLLTRLWTADPDNVARLQDPVFGPLMHSMGIESARCYLESALRNERTSWALGLETKLRESRPAVAARSWFRR